MTQRVRKRHISPCSYDAVESYEVYPMCRRDHGERLRWHSVFENDTLSLRTWKFCSWILFDFNVAHSIHHCVRAHHRDRHHVVPNCARSRRFYLCEFPHTFNFRLIEIVHWTRDAHAPDAHNCFWFPIFKILSPRPRGKTSMTQRVFERDTLSPKTRL